MSFNSIYDLILQSYLLIHKDCSKKSIKNINAVYLETFIPLMVRRVNLKCQLL